MVEMKRQTGKKYWRSLEELAETPRFREFVEREFPQHASEWFGGSRRTFLKIMGASMALAGLAGCRRWPADKLMPYAHRPVNRSDGVPVHYATAMELGGMGVGLVATSFDGRPIKVDGNPLHPLSAGSATTLMQASVLDVYDPDRSRGVTKRAELRGRGGDGPGDAPAMRRTASNWSEFAAFAKESIKPDGAGLVVLSEASRSPSVAAMRKQFPAAKWFEYEAVSNDHQRAGAMLAFGRPLRASPLLDKASVIVSIDADLFGGDVACTKYGRDFAAGRKLHEAPVAGATMNRLWVVETGFTNTGSMAEHRRGVKPSEIAGIVAAIAGAAGVPGVGAGNVDGELKTFIAALAKDLLENPGAAVVVAGGGVAPEVHAMVAAINTAIGAIGKTIEYYAEPEDPRDEKEWSGHAEQIKAFATAAVGADAVLIIGANPVYSAPADLKITEAIAKAKVSIHFGAREDETAKLCVWHLPQAHFLEAWGDVRTFDGTVSLIQPLIEPLFEAKSTIELLSLLSGANKAGYDLVREVARGDYLSGFFTEWYWKKSLFDGVVAGSARKPESVTINTGGISAAIEPAKKRAESMLELTFVTGKVHDGRFANNGWLQELPDSMTRVTWDNTLVLSPADATKLGVDGDHVVNVKSADGQAIRATVFVLPGQPVGVAGLSVGYGRTAAGAIADGVGSNAYALRTTNHYDSVGISISATGERNLLATVQDHHVIDAVGARRQAAVIPELVVEGTFAEYVRKPGLETRRVVALSMFNEHDYSLGHKWGMAIDLTTCTGCSACVVACQAENNIPIVGKEQVIRGREMHWLRIDRYFKHGAENPQAVHQPVMCMHCENAPCEEVCPVAATTHSAEGLNMMTYNRCIGTRYCSNNCPYKVRRFNFFDYNNGTKENLYTPNLLREDVNELQKMQKNPQVTVRSRGVMEKCSYCVQRIENARITMRAENRGKADALRIADGTVVTACQQSCPTGALVFGDLNDQGSRVAKLQKLAQSYGLLDPELNTKPRTQYMAKVRNPVSGLDAEMYASESASPRRHETH